MPKSLIVEIFADAKEFTAEMDRAAGKTRSIGRAAGVAGVAILGGLAYGLDKAVEASIKSQASEAAMATAFKASGESAAGYKGKIEEAQKAARDLGFSNIDTQGALAKLEVATRNGAESLKDLSTAEDLARFKHIDLSDASKILTSAMAGSARAARQLGIIVPTVTTHQDALKASSHTLKEEILKEHEAITKLTAAHSKSKESVAALAAAHEKLGTLEDALKNKTLDLSSAAGKAEIAHAKLADKQQQAAQVIDTVNQRLHGQADAFAQTTAGGIDIFHAHMEALQENLGSGLLPILTSVVGALANFAGYLADHTAVAKILIGALAGLGVVLLSVKIYSLLAAAASGVASAATGVWTAAQWLLNAALTANPIGLVIVGLVALGAALVIAYEKSATFRRIVGEAFDVLKTIVSAAISGIRTAVSAMVSFVEGLWNRFGGIITSVAKAAFGPLKTLIEADLHVVEDVIRLFGDVIHGRWGKIWDDLKHLVGDALHGIVAVIRSLVGAVTDAALEIGKGITGGILHGIGDLGGSLLSSLKDKIGGAVSGVKGFLHIGSPSKLLADEIGKPMGEGVIMGWLDSTESLPAKMSQSLQNAIEKARTTINNARSVFTAAFGNLMSVADSAFQAVYGAKQTEAGKKLAILQAAHDVQAAADEMAAAQKTLADARTDGDPDKIVAAQKAVDDLLYQAKVAALQKQDGEEQKQLQAREAVRKIHYDAAITALEDHLAKHGATAAQATHKILALLASFGINFKSVGADMGTAWIEGLKEQITKAATGAGKLSGTITAAADSIKVPHAATGAILTRPTMLLGGEGGEPEAVVPLSRAGEFGFGGGSGGIVFNDGAIQVSGFVGNEHQLAAAIVGLLANHGYRNGTGLPGVLGAV